MKWKGSTTFIYSIVVIQISNKRKASDENYFTARFTLFSIVYKTANFGRFKFSECIRNQSYFILEDSPSEWHVCIFKKNIVTSIYIKIQVYVYPSQFRLDRLTEHGLHSDAVNKAIVWFIEIIYAVSYLFFFTF